MARKTAGREAASLQTLLASTLSPIARAMISCDIGAGDLVQAAKLAYVRAAIEEVVPRGKRVNVSRLAVVTGMTRKEVASLLQIGSNQRPLAQRRKPMEQRARRVLRGWLLDPLFHSAEGKPAALEIHGAQRTLGSLVRAYGGDVTVAAVLQELLRMKAVKFARSGKLHVRQRTFGSGNRAAEQLEEFATLLRDFVDTTGQLVKPHDRPRYFGFRKLQVSTPAQAALFHRTFSRRAAMLLESVEQWQDRQQRPTRTRNRGRMQTRVGLGVYLVQRDTPAKDR